MAGFSFYIMKIYIMKMHVRQQTVEHDGMAATKLRFKGGF
jgi:hypothetical protein